MPSSSTMIEMCEPHWRKAVERRPIERLLDRDYTLWKPAPTEISNRLGWLDLPESMRGAVGELTAFAREVRDAGFGDVVLLGMGGSSLCPEVLRATFGPQKGFPRLHVLDSTVPSVVAEIERAIVPEKTLFIVASKSGGTIEVLSFYRYFRGVVQRAIGDEAGRNFVAITDPDTSLARMAAEHRFRKTFINPPDIGGRYSALSLFGLVPAALMGIDPGRLLDRAARMAAECRKAGRPEDNPAARLGLVSGCLALKGRDKLSILTSPALGTFGLWAEQLVAESTGKEGKGIVPIAQEPPAPPESYGDDRLFVSMRMAGDDNRATDRHVESLEKAGFPVIRIELADPYDLAAEFYRWEFAVAIAGAVLEINPFDQPNVQESKQITGKVLGEYETSRALPDFRDEGTLHDLLKAAKDGDYVAIMAFTNAPAGFEQAMGDLRSKILADRRLPTTFGYGPRFLHSTGQLHKGGPDSGLFVQLTCAAAEDMQIPGGTYNFSVLAAAQAIGDFNALRAHHRRVIRIHAASPEALVQRIRAMALER